MWLKQYFIKKPLHELTDEAKNSHDLERSLSAFQLVLLGIGAIVGAGIFVYVGTGAAHAGPAVILSFILGGLACVCAALCYAELAATIPLSGSVYTYSYATLGELPAWIIAGCMLLHYILSAAAVASGWSGYFVSFLAGYGIELPVQWVHTTGQIVTLADGTSAKAIINLPAACIVALLTFVLFYGIQASAVLNTIIVIVKLSVLSAFILLGAMYVNPANWTPFIPENTGSFGSFGLSGIISGASAIFLAFMGFDAVSTAAQETKNPQRDLPIGIIGSLAISTIFYVLIAGVLTGLIHYEALINSTEPLAKAIQALKMPWFSVVLKLGAVIGLTSVVLVLLYAAVRVLYTVTHDGLLPIGLAKCSKEHHTPHFLTMLVGLCVALLGSVINIQHLVALSAFGSLITLIVVCINVLYLRHYFPHLPQSFRCPLVPWIPFIGIFLFTLIMVGLPTMIFAYALTWIAFIVGIYLIYGRSHSQLQKEFSQ
jgi:APA family basic amino acid/polyamine antiporter